MDMDSVFNNTTAVAENKKQTLENAMERINSFQPTFADKLILWVNEYRTDFTYQYSGRRYNGIFSNEYDVDPTFSCNMPLEIKIYFKGLIDDIRNQMEKSFIALSDYYEFFEDSDEERFSTSKLPDSIRDFIQATGVGYGFVPELVALACDEDTYKFVVLDTYLYKGRPYSDLIVTANTMKANKIMKNAAENAQDVLDEMIEEAKDYSEDEYEKVKKFKWHDICSFKGNQKAHKVYIKYLIEDSGNDLEYYKNRLVNSLADLLDVSDSNSKEFMIQKIGRLCFMEDSLFDDIRGYIFLKYDIGIIRLDDEAKEDTECIYKIGEDLFEDILLRMLQKIQNK